MQVKQILKSPSHFEHPFAVEADQYYNDQLSFAGKLDDNFIWGRCLERDAYPSQDALSSPVVATRPTAWVKSQHVSETQMHSMTQEEMAYTLSELKHLSNIYVGRNLGNVSGGGF